MRQTFFQSPLLLTMMAFLLVACADKEDVLRQDDSDALTFNANVGRSGITRGTLDGTFDGTELMAVTMRTADASDWPVVRRYVAGTSGQLTHSADVEVNPEDVDMWRWPKSADAISVKGWHTADQYRTAVDGQEFSVPTDQSAGRSVMQGYDFLFAPATTADDRTNTSVTLDMWHQLSLIRIYIESDENLYAEDILNSVRMFGTEWTQRATYTEPTDEAKLFGAWSTYGGTYTPETAFTESVKPLLLSHSEDGKTVLFAALMVPQQTRGRQLISLDLLGIHYTYTLPLAEEESPDFLPGVVYTYHLHLKDKFVMATANLWDEEPHTTFGSTVNPWQDLNKSATYTTVTDWIRTNQHENEVTPDPWLPADPVTNINFWIVDWLSENKTGVMDYITLRQATDKDTIPVQTQDTLMYCNGWFIYSHGKSTQAWSQIGGGFSSPTYTTRTEGYVTWSILDWEHNQADKLTTANKRAQGPWAFRIDDNNRLKDKTINVLRLKSASEGTMTLRLYKKRKNTPFDLNDPPNATATFTAQYEGEEVIAKLSTPITFGYMDFLVIDAPDNTFYYDDSYEEAFYGHANTASWSSLGASLGIDVGYLDAPVTDTEGTWYITSCTDNGSAKLTESRDIPSDPEDCEYEPWYYEYDFYIYPLTMQARLRGHEFNAFRFYRHQYGTFFVWKIKRNGEVENDFEPEGYITVSENDETPAEQADPKLKVTRFLRDFDGNIISLTLADDEYLMICNLSNWYSPAGGTFGDYNASTYYRYGPEGYYTVPDGWDSWSWNGNQYGLLGVDVGYVNPN